MNAWRCLIMLIAFQIAGETLLLAEDAASDPAAIRTAIEKAIPLLEQGSSSSAEQRQCFTCHSQAVPVFALAELRKRGFTVDEENFTRQLDHTAKHLARGQKAYLSGSGQGGKVLTAGYALWMLEAGGRTADELTASVTHFLLEYQKDKNHWSHPGSRPPSSGSDFTATYVALHALQTYGTEEQQSQIKVRRAQVSEWLLSETPKDTEDRVFRLWALPYLDAAPEELDKATAELIAAQQADGGWAQTAEMKSDVYATATVLVALLKPGQIAPDDTAIQNGIKYLLSSQMEDGSWHVTTRAKGFQPYFESGFPHGKDQFISIAASGWATMALALVLPEEQPGN
jgi:N-acyl-D-amino-acid deacylase